MYRSAGNSAESRRFAPAARSAARLSNDFDRLAEDRCRTDVPHGARWLREWARLLSAAKPPLARLVTGRSVMPQGIDEREVAQIRGDVEGEAVRGDYLCHVNADGGDLAFSPCGGQLFNEVCGSNGVGLPSTAVDGSPHHAPVNPPMRQATPNSPQSRMSASSSGGEVDGPRRAPFALRKLRRSKIGYPMSCPGP